MSETSPYHFSPDLLEAFVDALALLARGKGAVLDIFRGCGVPEEAMAELRASLAGPDASKVRKAHLARQMLHWLNDDPTDSKLRYRRELVRRVTEWEDYSSSYPDDQLKAQGAVARVRDLVNVRDSFTRMAQERDREADERRAEARARAESIARRRQALYEVERDFRALFLEDDPQKRGKALEGVLNRLFAAEGSGVREAFTVVGGRSEGIIEQIDGVIELDSKLYLVEMKWHADRLGSAEVAPALVRAFARSDCGLIVISNSGFTEPAITTCTEALRAKTVVLAELGELLLALERRASLDEMLRAKVLAAVLDKKPMVWPGAGTAGA